MSVGNFNCVFMFLTSESEFLVNRTFIPVLDFAVLLLTWLDPGS